MDEGGNEGMKVRGRKMCNFSKIFWAVHGVLLPITVPVKCRGRESNGLSDQCR